MSVPSNTCLTLELRNAQVLWECGGTLAAPAIAAGVIHKALAFIAPKLVGPAVLAGTAFLECCNAVLHLPALCATFLL